MEEYKTCTKCGQTKALHDFPKQKDCYLGVAGRCKKCKYAKEIERKLADPEKYQEKARQQRVKGKDKRADYQREYRLSNPDKYRASARKLYWQDPEKFRARRRQYSKNNPETDQRNNRQRRARILQTKTEKYLWKDVVTLYGANCHLCKNPIDLDAPRWTAIAGWEEGLHLDHVLPLSMGGEDTLDNVRPAHGKCNLAKNRILPTAFRSEAEK